MKFVGKRLIELNDILEKIVKILESKKNTFEIEFNPHWIDYRTLKEFIAYYEDEDEDITYADFISEEDKQKCIEKDTMWVITFYPHTPISHFSIAGSNLKFVLEEFLKYIQEEL